MRSDLSLLAGNNYMLSGSSWDPRLSLGGLSLPIRAVSQGGPIGAWAVITTGNPWKPGEE